ncbi:hypothetical protein GCM10009795_018720 [Nocardioides hankookensis]|uniref:TetR/AcrR family transcriptional regulator n=1 Tax=Nocardioides hankookensis TaxID=443157 RepID=A0ABW1LLK0_9ACTN
MSSQGAAPVRRTPGGWTPVGTAASRRTAHESNGTERGRASRRKIVEAARTVFERDGFFDARIEDVVATAGVARGTFYTYFSTKIDVLMVIAGEINESFSQVADVDHTAIGSYPPEVAVPAYVERVLDTCRENARVMEIIDQVATTDDTVRAARRHARDLHIQVLTAAILDWQRADQVPADLPASVTADALVSMMEGYTRWWTPGEQPYDVVVSSLSAVCLRSLGVALRPHS